MKVRNSVLLGLGGALILALSACGGVSVGDENANIATAGALDDSMASTPESDPAFISVADIDTDEDSDEDSDEQYQSEDPADVTIDTLVGFFVTGSKGELRNYAGITSDGQLTDYTYDQAADCYHPASTLILDQGSGVFWVQDGDVTTELRFGRQNGNLVLFRDDINEDGRVVYPGITTVVASDLQMCG